MTTIKLKNGSGAPLAGDLVQGEPALDLTNKRLYTENSSGAVIEVGTNPSTINIDAGTIDGTVIGGSTAAAGSFTTFTSTGIDDNAASTAITIDGSQNVGIGTSSPTSYSGQTNLNINSAGVSRIDFDISDALQGYALSESGYIALFANTGKYLILGANNTEAIRIDASGSVGIGTSSPSTYDSRANNLVVGDSGDAGVTIFSGSTSNARLQFAPSGATGLDNGLIDYDNNNDSMSFATGGSERMRIDSSGNVGIGTSSPSGPLNVHSASGDTNLYVTTGNTAASTNIFFGDSDNSAIGRIVYDHNGNYMKFRTNGSDAMRIDSSGLLQIGTTGKTGRINLQPNPSNNHFVEFYTTADGKVGEINTTGGTTTNYVTSSDYRLKENVVPLTGATERVKQLNPSRFNFIANADTTVDGFLAHEVADVVPEAISGTKDAMRDEEYEVTPAVYEDVVIPAVLDEEGNEVEAERTEQQLVTEAVMGTRSVPDYQGIDQSKLVPLLVATIQELEARITALESN